MKRRLLMALAAIAGLSGCVSEQQLASKDEATCVASGAPAGTPEHARCRLLVYQDRMAARRVAAARLSAFGAAMSGAGNSLSAAAKARDAQSPPAAAPIYGFTKVCNYQTPTGPRAITIGSAELCPLTLPYP